MTSMIDVVFLLLIFFVVAAAGQKREASLATTFTEPGSVASTTEVERDPWVIEVWLKLAVDANRRTIVMMNDRPIANAEALSQQMRALVELEPDTPVILDIAPDVPMRDVIQVDDVCRAAGCQSIHFSARAEDVLRLDANRGH